MADARKIALRALESTRRAGTWSEAALNGALASAGAERRDRALASALCYGVLQNRTLIDETIRAVSTQPLQRIEPKVLDILRLSVCQLLFLDKIPASAAVNEGVRLCRELGYARAAGFVNAVLRRIAAKPGLPETGIDAEGLALRWSHPLWLTRLLLDTLGPEEAEAFLRLDNTPAPLDLQVNTLKTTAEALRSSLAAEGVAAEPHPFLPDCLRTERGGDLTALRSYQEGGFYVQDAGAKLAVLAADPRPGTRILDACAAPGGKSFASAILSGGTAEILSCDCRARKLDRLRDGARRLGLEGISVAAADAGAYQPELDGAFDLVLADVPCSGLGVIRKKPEIRWKDPAEFEGLPEKQLRILKNVSRYVRPGGLLLYATCTVRPEENGDIVARFLAEAPGFSPEDFSLPDGVPSERGARQLWPQRHGTDGFYFARLRKSGRL